MAAIIRFLPQGNESYSEVSHTHNDLLKTALVERI